MKYDAVVIGGGRSGCAEALRRASDGQKVCLVATGLTLHSLEPELKGKPYAELHALTKAGIAVLRGDIVEEVLWGATASDPVRGSAAHPSQPDGWAPPSNVAEGGTPLGGSTSPARPAPAPLRVLDLCTGSGCIAWTLALDIPGAQVVATDLSEEALELARSQFGKRDAIPGWTGRLPKRVIPPKFVRADLLDVEATVAAVPGGIDLLTANPPYVMVAEKAEMRQNVLGWEPHMAIFAPEEDPLVFHRAIAEVALRVLVPGGCGIVEINSELPDQTAAVFTAAGFVDVSIIPDYFDRPRFVSFRRK